MKRRGMSLALCAAMAMGTIGVVPAMADDVTTITYWVNDRHDSEYMTEMVEKYNKENTDNIYIDMQIITDDYENMISLAKECCKKVNPEIGVFTGRVVSGDQFISDKEKKKWLTDTFAGYCTEMEGAAIAHAAL